MFTSTTTIQDHWSAKEQDGSMSSNKLGLGLIGHPQSAWMMSCPRARYVAGCDVNEKSCAAARANLGVDAYTDYHDLIVRSDVDVVVVRTPNAVHKQPTIDALNAGKHVFCEKPLALTMDDCEAMADAARRNGRMLQINLELRSSVLPRRMKELVDSGELGTVRRILFHHYQGAWDMGPDHWRMNQETSGGLFPEKLVHEVDVFRWIVGEVESVQSFYADNVIPQLPYPDCLQSMFWFANGALGSMLHTQARSAVNVSPEEFGQYGHEMWFDILGDNGCLKADFWGGTIDVYHYQPGKFAGSRETHFARREDYIGLGMHALGHDSPAHLAEFVRRILDGEPELQSPEDALLTMALTFAAERSVHTGNREVVD